ncbi:Nek1 [Scenedesmus sp. PABB004]|nr:Nek1 [Scenedesmus sp. PABB004]
MAQRQEQPQQQQPEQQPLLTEFEAARAARIARNEAVLAELGLNGEAERLAAAAGAKRAKKRPWWTAGGGGKEQALPAEPSRRSRRLAAQPAEHGPLDYDEDDDGGGGGAAPPLRAARRPSSSALATLSDDAHHAHNLHRLSYMSEQALIRRAWKITNLAKLRSFVEVLEGMEGMEAVAAEARTALAARDGGGAALMMVSPVKSSLLKLVKHLERGRGAREVPAQPEPLVPDYPAPPGAPPPRGGAGQRPPEPGPDGAGACKRLPGPEQQPAAATAGAANGAAAAVPQQQQEQQQQQQRQRAQQEQLQEQLQAQLQVQSGAPMLGRASSSSSVPEEPPDLSRSANASTVSSLTSGGQSRRTSQLGESGRASRRSSLMRDSLSDSPVPPILQQQAALAGTPSPASWSAAEPFWSSPWSFGAHSDQNQRTHMEDRVACTDLSGQPEFAGCARAGFFAVFDGHAGHEAAEHLENHLLRYVLAAGAAGLAADPLGALAAAVRQAEAEILTQFAAARCNAGSTLLALLLVDDKLHIANVGDSRAVLGRGSDAQQLTRDHKPACSLEAARIEADDPAADISCDGYMYGELAVARAIGSAHIKRDPSKRALIPTPDLLSVQLRAEDDFVVLATDGLWDKVDNAEVVAVARRALAAGPRAEPAGGGGGGGAAARVLAERAAESARALVERALRRSSSDNISVITLLLHGRGISLPKSNSMLFRRSALAGLPGGADSPRCSTPCSGLSTPAVATPRSGTPVGPAPADAGAASPPLAMAEPPPQRVLLGAHGREYALGGTLGCGAAGKALLATQPGGELVVVKQAEAVNEARVMQSLDHLNIVRCVEAVVDGDILSIVLEHCARGDLARLIAARAAARAPLSEDEVMFWFVQVALALWQLHRANVLHCDLKPANIFISDGPLAKLGDFGVARRLSSEHELARTAVRRGPRAARPRPAARRLTPATTGVVLYELVTLRRPFEALSLPALVLKILRARPAPLPSGVSPQLRALLGALLAREPSARPSIDAVLRLDWVKHHLARYAQHVMRLSRAPGAAAPRPAGVDGGQAQEEAQEEQGGGGKQPAAPGRRAPGLQAATVAPLSRTGSGEEPSSMASSLASDPSGASQGSTSTSSQQGAAGEGAADGPPAGSPPELAGPQRRRLLQTGWLKRQQAAFDELAAQMAALPGSQQQRTPGKPGEGERCAAAGRPHTPQQPPPPQQTPPQPWPAERAAQQPCSAARPTPPSGRGKPPATPGAQQQPPGKRTPCGGRASRRLPGSRQSLTPPDSVAAARAARLAEKAAWRRQQAEEAAAALASRAARAAELEAAARDRAAAAARQANERAAAARQHRQQMRGVQPRVAKGQLAELGAAFAHNFAQLAGAASSGGGGGEALLVPLGGSDGAGGADAPAPADGSAARRERSGRSAGPASAAGGAGASVSGAPGTVGGRGTPAKPWLQPRSQRSCGDGPAVEVFLPPGPCDRRGGARQSVQEQQLAAGLAPLSTDRATRGAGADGSGPDGDCASPQAARVLRLIRSALASSRGDGRAGGGGAAAAGDALALPPERVQQQPGGGAPASAPGGAEALRRTLAGELGEELLGAACAQVAAIQAAGVDGAAAAELALARLLAPPELLARVHQLHRLVALEAAPPPRASGSDRSTATAAGTAPTTTAGAAAGAAAGGGSGGGAGPGPAQLQQQQQQEQQEQQQPAPRGPFSPWSAPTAAIGVSGPYLTTSSIDGDSMVASAQFLERELAGPFSFGTSQLSTIHELAEAMRGCSTAFVGVAGAGIALTLAASAGMEMDEAPEVLFNGITVGDVASWVDSLLVAYLLAFGAASFERVEGAPSDERKLAFTFQGINRLGLMFTQFSIAATTVSIVTTLEAASKWPPLVTLASGLFFAGAVGRSCAMWYVLSKYGTTLDDVDAALETQRRCAAAAHDEGLPLGDRLAIRLAFSYLLQLGGGGRQPSEAALSSAAAVASAAPGGGAGAPGAPGGAPGVARGPLAAASAAAAVAVRAGGRSAGAAAAGAARAGLSLLQRIPLPIISRSEDGEDGGAAPREGGEGGEEEEQAQAYVLTQAEERLVQACQSSLNNAGLALVLQAAATGMLLTANLANHDVSTALADGIQVVNKAVAAELIFVATTNFDEALYSQGCDVEHLLQGLGERGLSRLFHNLSILAWAVVIAKGVELVAPWEEQSPLLKFIGENFSHQAADVVLESQELLVNLLHERALLR